jgi:hypothetical protein
MPISKEAVGRLMAGADPAEVLGTGADDR